MARITVEDCKQYVPNRFKLVILAAQRAKDIMLGVPSLIQRKNDKEHVLALREIAAGMIDCVKLEELVVLKQKNPTKHFEKNKVQNDEIEELFKELASKVEDTTTDSAMLFNDGYENDDSQEDDCCDHYIKEESDENNEEESDEEEKMRKASKQAATIMDESYDDIEE